MVGRGEYGERFVSIVERGNVMGAQFHPGEVLARRARAAAQLRRRRGWPRDPLPGDRHPRRQGGAAHARPLRRRDRLPRRPARGGARRGSRRARASCTSSTSTAPGPARRRRSSTCARIVAGTGVPVQYGGGLRTVDAVRDALRAGAERVIVGTAALRDVDFLDEIVAAYGPARASSRSTCAAARSPPPAGPQVTDMPAADAIGRLHDRGVASFVYTDADRDGALEGPSLDDVARDRRRGARALPLRGRDRRRSSTCARCASCARSTCRA